MTSVNSDLSIYHIFDITEQTKKHPCPLVAFAKRTFLLFYLIAARTRRRSVRSGYAQKRFDGGDHVRRILGTGRFKAGVHGQLRKADIHGIQ